MFEAPALENTQQWHRSKQQIKTSHTPCRRTISHAPAPEARIRQQFKTNRSPLDTRFCTHAVYDSDDLTPCSINHKSGCVFIDLLPSRFGEKACFAGLHIGLWGGPTAPQSVLTQKGSRGKCKTPAPASPPPGAWCLVLKGREGGCSNISKLKNIRSKKKLQRYMDKFARIDQGKTTNRFGVHVRS